MNEGSHATPEGTSLPTAPPKDPPEPTGLAALQLALQHLFELDRQLQMLRKKRRKLGDIRNIIIDYEGKFDLHEGPFPLSMSMDGWEGLPWRYYFAYLESLLTKTARYIAASTQNDLTELYMQELIKPMLNAQAADQHVLKHAVYDHEIESMYLDGIRDIYRSRADLERLVKRIGTDLMFGRHRPAAGPGSAAPAASSNAGSTPAEDSSQLTPPRKKSPARTLKPELLRLIVQAISDAGPLSTDQVVKQTDIPKATAKHYLAQASVTLMYIKNTDDGYVITEAGKGFLRGQQA